VSAGPRLGPDCESFVVEEIQEERPGGTGEHCWVLVEKRNLDTERAARCLARAAGVPRRAIGYAGRKDKKAVTRQWFSLHFGDPDRARGAEDLCPEWARLTVLESGMHRRKLRLGHCRGNRFRLRILDRDRACDDALRRLGREGLRNAFGDQRFGRGGNNLAIARRWADGDHRGAVIAALAPEGDWDGEGVPPDRAHAGEFGRIAGHLAHRPDDHRGALGAAGERWRRLIANAAQAACFNAVLEAREAAGLLFLLRPGDVAMNPGGSCFAVAEADAEDCTRRCDPGTERRLVTSAPMPGPDAPMAEGDLRDEEESWLCGGGFASADFGADRPLRSPGERRPLLVPFLEAPRWEAADVLTFALPSGSYATTVLEAAGIDAQAHR